MFAERKTCYSALFTNLVGWHAGAVSLPHRHLRNIDCLTAHTACLVCFITTVNGCSKRKRILLTNKTGTSTGHITKLKQSILLRCLWPPPKWHYFGPTNLHLSDIMFWLHSRINNLSLCRHWVAQQNVTNFITIIVVNLVTLLCCLSRT